MKNFSFSFYKGPKWKNGQAAENSEANIVAAYIFMYIHTYIYSDHLGKIT